MDCIQKITPDIYWVGGSDRRLALFENMFPLENGVTYNAYVILDEKTAFWWILLTAQFVSSFSKIYRPRWTGGR